MGFIVEEEEPAKKKKGSKKRKKKPGGLRLRSNLRREPVSRFWYGRRLANERVYVFARLHQMIYSRLLEAKGLCEDEKNRQDEIGGGAHQV